MPVDVSSLVTLVGGAGAAVGSVGMAVTGVKAMTKAFRYCRDVLGYSTSESLALARQHNGNVYDLDGKFAAGRQMEKEYEQMWSSRGEGRG